MKRGLILWIALGVLAAHGLFFWLIRDESALPKQSPVAGPNFVEKEALYTDPDTGAKMRVQEYTVSTRLNEGVRLAAPENTR